MTKDKKMINKEGGKVKANKSSGSKVERKRKFRENKYKSAFGNKSEGHGFAEASKMKVIREYKRWQAKERKKLGNKSGTASDAKLPEHMQPANAAQIQGSDGESSGLKKKSSKSKRFQKAASEAEERKKRKRRE